MNKKLNLSKWLCLLLVAGVTLTSVGLHAQNLVSGEVTGTVSDPTGAVLANVTVTLKSVDAGFTQTTTTNTSGAFRFSFLKPGNYTVSAAPTGFEAATRSAVVSLGQVTDVVLKMNVAGATETLEVRAEGATVQTENGNISTSFTQAQLAEVPNPGNDLTYFALSAPGAAMNSQGGYANFSTYGLPGTSNLFTVNGMNDNDPFMNLNNSGATNLMLGANDISEATVVNNGYSVQYGGLGGSNVNFVTKSGTNQWHGNAQMFYNDDSLNANSWLNNNSDTPKSFALAQQYAGSIGGPIKKDKAFIFFNAEGLYVTLPTSETVAVPSPAIESAILSSIPASETAFYNNIFKLYNNAGGSAVRTAAPNGGCPSLSSLAPGGAAYNFVSSGGVCADQFTSTAGNQTHENMQMGRFDYNIGNNDRAYIHIRRDMGVQATYTDPISPVFDEVSNQPDYEGQFNETHTFGTSSVNQFVLSGMYYGAVFNVPNVSSALSAMPFSLGFTGTLFYPLGRDNSAANGRNVTQYQLIDDFSHTRGNHDLKFGFNFVRDDVTDYDIMQYAQAGSTISSPVINTAGSETLDDFFNGVSGSYIQQFPSDGRTSAPIATYGLGIYAQDEWRARRNLKLTFGLRAEHNSNPVCQIDCFSRFATDFSQVNPALPDNQSLLTNQSQAFTSFDAINWEPRFGFAYSPLGESSGLVVRGGFGIFVDKFPAQIADYMLFNSPFNNGFVVNSSPLLTQAASTAAAMNQQFVNGFSTGQTVPAVQIYSPAGSLHSPRYQEWNLQVEKAIGRSGTLSVNYVGNHGIHEPYLNGGVNAFDAPGSCTNGVVTSGISCTSPGGFGGLPLAAPNGNYSTVYEVESNAVSNYNGVTISFSRRFHSLQFQANYTYSHALDEISNGGLLPMSALDNTSILNPQDPNALREYNYGNADYDVRHYASFNWVWDTPKQSNKYLNAIATWTVSGTLFVHSGYPYTVTDNALAEALSNENYGMTGGASIFANQLVGGTFSCGSNSNPVVNPCAAMLNNFASPNNTWGNERRNQLYGPSYFNTSMTLMKNFAIPHWEAGKLGLGAQFFNIFNHPNLDQPVSDISNSYYGTIQRTVATPTSMYGSFLGADASPRQIQLRATLNF